LADDSNVSRNALRLTYANATVRRTQWPLMGDIPAGGSVSVFTSLTGSDCAYFREIFDLGEIDHSR